MHPLTQVLGSTRHREIVELLGRISDADASIAAALATLSERKAFSNLKVSQRASYPLGTAAKLDDLESYFDEFHRIARHAAGGGDPCPQDLVTSLLAAWPRAIRWNSSK